MGRKYKYELGDLVVCKYDFEYIYYPSYMAGESDKLFFIGIIIDRRDHTVIFFGQDVMYKVLCTDGVCRNFTTWEIEAIRRAHPDLQIPDK